MKNRSLLSQRFCDLKLSLKGSIAEKCIKQLRAELKAKNIKQFGYFWISDEWFVPDDTTGIALPFYLFSPQLLALEKEMMGHAEGEKEEECMQLLRHEMGHVIDNAFNLRENKQRKRLFGDSDKDYPDSYIAKPYSKKYVCHLPDHYAQSHPDEDFAETFALWLTPHSNWKKKYKNWKALEKLQFMDNLAKKIKNKKANLVKQIIDPIEENTMTLEQFYRQKTQHHCTFQRKFQPKKSLFVSRGVSIDQIPIHNYKKIKKKTATISGLYQYQIEKMFTDIKKYCHENKLFLKKNNSDKFSLALAKEARNYYKQGYHRMTM